MKRLLTIFGIAGAVTAAIAADLGREIRVRIPFDFMVCDQRIPAGEYVVRDTGIRDTVAIHRDAQRNWTTFHPLGIRKLDGASETMLVFDKIQGQHFLREVWVKGRHTGLLVPQGKMQREMTVQTEPPLAVVAVAAR